MTKKGSENDLDRAARLLSMRSWGFSLDVEDQLWLGSWTALMHETEDTEYGPSVMWSSRTSKKKGDDAR